RGRAAANPLDASAHQAITHHAEIEHPGMKRQPRAEKRFETRRVRLDDVEWTSAGLVLAERVDRLLRPVAGTAPVDESGTRRARRRSRASQQGAAREQRARRGWSRAVQRCVQPIAQIARQLRRAQAACELASATEILESVPAPLAHP